MTVEYLYKCRCCGEVFTDVTEATTKPLFMAILDDYCNDNASDFPNKAICYWCNSCDNFKDNKGGVIYGIADFIGVRVYEKD